MKKTFERLEEVGSLAGLMLAMGVIGRRGRDEEAKLLTDGTEEPVFVAPTDGHFFDLGRNGDSEIAKVFLEERVDVPVRRIVRSDPVRTRGGKPDIKFSEYNVHAMAELVATQRSFELARSCDLVIWISPEDGARGLTVVEAKKKRTGIC